ncbi:IclR family transcriptional regulator [Neisseria animalis]|uniref:IclR family transcriptional regulator n=1 Tax=Neisseria animalis TaxID=492 RepID=A0A5P3MSG5_NEIAN|nr:IclR family transcriptional regulator C-terminal domain-containing protein [Neisseria animalis]QEY24556.1 IclR family transcriptional regulator [Neisseria animalis]ROW33028.1 IclR family transcriptional regulator [Neisseria animalis]VEE07355.1 Pectin degradation repressor protein kdgR [Neisseria animalis]
MHLLNRAFSVSAYINAAEKPVSPREITQALAIPLSTLYRLVAILKDWGYVADSTEAGLLTSGPVFLHNGLYLRYGLLPQTARQSLLKLAGLTRETVAVITSTPVQTVCIDMVESPQRLRCSFAVGEVQSPVRGASAKTLLAFHEPEKCREIIKLSLSDSQEQEYLYRNLSEIRRQGYGTSLGEVDENIWGVSAPIFKKDTLLGVVTVMVPEHRAIGQKERFVRSVLDCTTSINELIRLA